MKLRLAAITLAFIVICPFLGITANDPAGLVACRGILNKSIKKYEISHESSINKWCSSYNKALIGLRKKCQDTGKLDDLLVIKTEMDRLVKTKKLDKIDIVDSPASLKNIQEYYRKLYMSQVLKNNQQIVTLFEKYIARLKAAQTKSTQNEKIEEALAYREEAESARSRAEYTVAKSEVAIIKDEMGAAREAAAEKVASSKPAEEPKETPKEPISHNNGCTVYPPGVRLPKTGIVYKRTSLSDTKRASAKKKVSCLAHVREDKTGLNKSRSYYGSSTFKTGSSLNYVRLQVRTAASSINEDFDVYVEYYSKPVGSSGSIEPELFGTHHIPIEGLDSKYWYIDCKPVSLSIREYKRRSRYRSTYYSTSSYYSDKGGEFYGIIVSAYDKEGNLTYQGCSNSKLATVATAEKPE